MNKRYMDFVPKNTTKKVVKKELVLEPKKELPATKTAAKTAAKPATAKKPAVEPKKKPALPPKPAFVNTEKIRKRPLSKNFYPKKMVEPKEEVPSAPVTIINKPEKDSKAGLIVTIIITIILGAAAGTVAFLLLPK